MPHHSGGGSHHGGSRGGHHRSGSSRKGPTVSSRPFHGARRFRYRTRRGYRYVYSTGVPKAPSVFEGIITFIVIIAVFANTFPMLGEMIPSAPKKLKTSAPSSFSLVDDNAGVIDNKKELTDTLTEFYNLTGIIPSVVTVNNEDWAGDKLEDCAFDMYLERFSDENHFLLVYSEPRKPNRNDIDWHWDAIQGDNTDNIITEAHFRIFQSDLMTFLENKSPGEAIELAFENSLSYMMNKEKSGNDSVRIMMAAIILFFIAMALFPVIKSLAAIGRQYEEVPEETSPTDDAYGFGNYRGPDIK